MPKHSAQERHFISRVGWLRAAVLGANDGIISVASLIAGVAATSVDKGTVVVTGVAALVAGALSMAAGEYVSVSSQADTEASDMARERQELADFPEAELEELTQIYIGRGLPRDLAAQVAAKLMETDAFGAHARDELGISEHGQARPIQAALTSAATFAVGAALPLFALVLSPRPIAVWVVTVSSLVFLGGLGAVGAAAGGSGTWKAVARVMFWGALAMAITAAIGQVFGTVV
ncbi:VIT family protein [Asticcacaulis sp. AC402]|uniref:VIT1/CCC1 transporter family protein n=1 Tax=Asticcacaulis sp. AC402 TaxID=1282361 RepID=UPI0003C3CF56|nr:VIT family protein [Asticcacaulis sp. AC402]ESQ73593.1 membrane protein [Asticcacaulis sp. AC402]